VIQGNRGTVMSVCRCRPWFRPTNDATHTDGNSAEYPSTEQVKGVALRPSAVDVLSDPHPLRSGHGPLPVLVPVSITAT
jgi:hypothetical protein